MFVRFGHYVLKGRRQAASMALLFAVFPLMGWLSMMIVGLVTLREGAKEGAWVLLWASLPVVVLGFLHYPALLIYSALAGSLYVWGMAWLLRYSSSWTLVIEFSALVAVVVIFVLHGLVPDLGGWWQGKYQHVLSQMTEDGISSQGSLVWDNFIATLKDKQAIEKLAMISTGSILAFVMFSKLVLLSLSRWWQALLFNPKGLRPELCQVRLGYVALVGLLICCIGVWMSLSPVVDILPVIFVTFAMAGLSVIHFWVGRAKRGLMTVVTFYLLFMLLPTLVIGLLFLLAIADSLFDLRKRWQLISSH